MFGQDDDLIASYLSGVVDSCGKVSDPEHQDPFIKILIDKRDERTLRIRKAMHVFGIVAPKKSRHCFTIEISEDIESMAVALDLRNSNKAENLARIIRSDCAKNNNSIGYKLGEVLKQNRISVGLTKYLLGISPASITRYENGGMIPHEIAVQIAETLQNNVNPESAEQTGLLGVTELVCSDIVGVKVTKVIEIGKKWAYDLCCKGNNNFFANDILCHNCILWCDKD